MSKKFLNNSNIPLSIAVYLASDDYDYDSTAISATSLLKPVRQLILARRVAPEDALVDIMSLNASRRGQAIHTAIEHAWKNNYRRAMRALGYSDKVIDRIKINPEDHELTPDTIPVYMEQREYREINGVRISGKYDFVAEGRVEDFKTTSTFTYSKGSKVKDYQLQGSIYRWLNPKKITQDTMRINYIFTDWKNGFGYDQNYPSQPILPVSIPLLSLEETENYIVNKLNEIAIYSDKPEHEIPLCTNEDLWRGAPTFKYYKNPAKRDRSTKNFDTLLEANKRLIEDGNVGVVIEVPGSVTACKYCPAFTACTQKDTYLADGSLTF